MMRHSKMRIIKYIAGMNSNQPLWIYYVYFIQKKNNHLLLTVMFVDEKSK